MINWSGSLSDHVNDLLKELSDLRENPSKIPDQWPVSMKEVWPDCREYAESQINAEIKDAVELLRKNGLIDGQPPQ